MNIGEKRIESKKYQGKFYKDVSFMDKKDFREMYVEQGYFAGPLRG